MANVKIVSEPSSVTVVVSPYDKVSFKTFLNLFPTPQSFDVASYNRIRLSIQIARDFTTATNQKTCFDKFTSSVKDLAAVNYRYVHKYPQPFMHAYKCYTKLRNLIFSNSFIFQHFGIEDPSFAVLPCKNLSMKEYHVCETHSKCFGRQEALIRGHACLDDDDHVFAVPYSMSELQVGLINNDVKTINVIEFISKMDRDSGFSKEFAKQFMENVSAYDQQSKQREMNVEDILIIAFGSMYNALQKK